MLGSLFLLAHTFEQTLVDNVVDGSQP